MIDRKCLNDVLTDYKKDFRAFHWNEEKYKWEAVKCFQDNWDINAPDFPEMLTRSLSKTGNLLVSAKYFPANMIIGFANESPEEVRAMAISGFEGDAVLVQFHDGISNILSMQLAGAAKCFRGVISDTDDEMLKALARKNLKEVRRLRR